MAFDFKEHFADPFSKFIEKEMKRQLKAGLKWTNGHGEELPSFTYEEKTGYDPKLDFPADIPPEPYGAFMGVNYEDMSQAAKKAVLKQVQENQKQTKSAYQAQLTCTCIDESGRHERVKDCAYHNDQDEKQVLGGSVPYKPEPKPKKPNWFVNFFKSNEFIEVLIMVVSLFIFIAILFIAFKWRFGTADAEKAYRLTHDELVIRAESESQINAIRSMETQGWKITDRRGNTYYLEREITNAEKR